jgi:hypothetical protein
LKSILNQRGVTIGFMLSIFMAAFPFSFFRKIIPRSVRIMNECVDSYKIHDSAAHMLAATMVRLFPHAKLDIGPSTRTGFYYAFDIDHKISQEDLKKSKVR